MSTVPRFECMRRLAAWATAALASFSLLIGATVASANPASTAADRAARVLAGLDVAASAEIGLPPAVLERYVRLVSRAWHDYERDIGGALRAWSRSELEPARDGTVFYPFSGPDLVTVNGFYPGARRYVLVALQHAEPVLDLAGASPAVATAVLDRLARAWDSFARLGFFRTPDLQAEAQREGPRIGITTPLMAFSSRLGMTVQAVDPVRINAAGTDLELHPGERDDRHTWRSVRLRLTVDGRSVLVDYVQADLSDPGLSKDPAMRRWIESMARHPTVLKAASHLLQRPHFSTLRDAILAHAPSVVQDETGIDYAELARVFRVALYGRFTGPHPLFAPSSQRSLVEAYQAAGETRPLPFRVSYQRQSTANLQVAVRAAVPGADVPGQSTEERMRALSASIGAQLDQYAKRPRRLFLTRRVGEAEHAEYVESVRARLSAFLPSSPVVPLRAALVSLTVMPDGTLRSLHVERSSGNAAYDEWLRALPPSIVRLPAWPTATRSLADELVVTLHLP